MNKLFYIAIVYVNALSIFCSDANEKLNNYFKEFVIDEQKITITLKESGIRYILNNKNAYRISLYGEIIEIPVKTYLRINSKDVELNISYANSADLKKLNLSDYEYNIFNNSNAIVMKETIDLRSIGKNIEERIYIIFSLKNGISTKELGKIIDLTKTNKFKLISQKSSILMIECLNTRGGIIYNTFLINYKNYELAKKSGDKVKLKEAFTKLQNMGIIILPNLLEKIKAGESDLIPMFSYLTDGKVAATATAPECESWWEKNKSDYADVLNYQNLPDYKRETSAQPTTKAENSGVEQSKSKDKAVETSGDK